MPNSSDCPQVNPAVPLPPAQIHSPHPNKRVKLLPFSSLDSFQHGTLLELSQLLDL